MDDQISRSWCILKGFFLQKKKKKTKKKKKQNLNQMKKIEQDQMRKWSVKCIKLLKLSKKNEEDCGMMEDDDSFARCQYLFAL